MSNIQAGKISVVTIFLNGLPWLHEAIESVLAQTGVNFEYILVDDGSVDGSSELGKSYAAQFPGIVRYIDHPGHANRGMSASRNAGVAVAAGEYLAFIDADDIWKPGKLERQLSIFSRFPELAMVADSAIYWSSWNDGTDKTILAGHLQNQPVNSPDALLHTYPLGRAHAPCPSGILIRRSAYEAVGGFEASFTGPLQMYEDQAFLSKVYLRFPVLFADDCDLLYRQHPSSCVAENVRSGNYGQVRLHFLQWLGAYLELEGTNDPRIRAALRRALLPFRFPNLYAFLRQLIRLSRKVARPVLRQVRQTKPRPV